LATGLVKDVTINHSVLELINKKEKEGDPSNGK
jgi:hypothetical protein